MEMDKLAIINSIPVAGMSASCGELEYIFIKNAVENVNKLLEIGVPEEEITEMKSDDGDVIDISGIGFQYTKAKWFEKRLGGFLDSVPEHAPEWAK